LFLLAVIADLEIENPPILCRQLRLRTEEGRKEGRGGAWTFTGKETGFTCGGGGGGGAHM
jgi:hypothetical protein